MTKLKRLLSKSFPFLASMIFVVLLAHPGTSEVLQIGQEGTAVIELQKNLKSQNLYLGSVDGYYGEETRKAVQLFQKQTAQLADDGIAGSQTQNLLSKAVPVSRSLESVPWISSSLAMDSLVVGVATSGGVVAVTDSISKSKRRYTEKTSGGLLRLSGGTLQYNTELDEGYISIEIYDYQSCEYVAKTEFSMEFGKECTISSLKSGSYQMTICGNREGRRFTDRENFQM